MAKGKKQQQQQQSAGTSAKPSAAAATAATTTTKPGSAPNSKPKTNNSASNFRSANPFDLIRSDGEAGGDSKPKTVAQQPAQLKQRKAAVSPKKEEKKPQPTQTAKPKPEKIDAGTFKAPANKAPSQEAAKPTERKGRPSSGTKESWQRRAAAARDVSLGRVDTRAVRTDPVATPTYQEKPAENGINFWRVAVAVAVFAAILFALSNPAYYAPVENGERVRRGMMNIIDTWKL
ncbi:hypothetical protein HK102_013757 [Quaeritorhiza haematococci]|nr:hypothetical protein HK102_013757 [Quaeritorhiza haematococci]